MAQDTFVCDRCGNTFEKRVMKEVFFEQGERSKRVKKELCPTCLDHVMKQSSGVRGIVGDEKAAAVHIDDGEATAARRSFGRRET